KKDSGYEILKVKGWDYTALIHAYENASDIARDQHVPVIIHVNELTQPQGHSTSGSHERYKSEERLAWERENDCNKRYREWILENKIATEEELKGIEKNVKRLVRSARKEAWEEFLAPHREERKILVGLLEDVANTSPNKNFIVRLKNDLIAIEEPIKKNLASKARKAMRYLLGENSKEKEVLATWIDTFLKESRSKFNSHLYNEQDNSAIHVKEIKATYGADTGEVDGRVILRDNFDLLFAKYPELLIFGEDSGAIGDVNQGLEGLQKKYGELRVADTGIREATIIGQGIGMAMRGLRPIAEIQYLDYIFYALFTLTDDLATLLYRTVGRQRAPLIVRTRGHRLEGIWHSGSQMGGLIHLLRGMYILVPRNMTKAAGFYNTLMKGNEPALLIESLNGYRLKEPRPDNLGELCTPIGAVEVIKPGNDITLLSYGSTLRLVVQAAQELKEVGIDAEIIDAQCLLPFDLGHDLLKSVQKTNRLLIIDEDVPGGCSAYLMHQVMEEQGAYKYMDSAPQTLTAEPHRPAYATDGDYFSKPNTEDIFEKVYAIMRESDPLNFPKLR
ncbi:MAG TPA: transketolase C-terminal domain-containing protein, partial [Arenibacter sp.]|nr:transketolase C-terminal domain-containing protein [Arenibacter sp.]